MYKHMDSRAASILLYSCSEGYRWLQANSCLRLAWCAAYDFAMICLMLPPQAPGELGTFGQAWNPYPDNPVAFSKLQLKELKNGRLAMLAIMGKLPALRNVLNQNTPAGVSKGHSCGLFRVFDVVAPSCPLFFRRLGVSDCGVIVIWCRWICGRQVVTLVRVKLSRVAAPLICILTDPQICYRNIRVSLTTGASRLLPSCSDPSQSSCSIKYFPIKSIFVSL